MNSVFEQILGDPIFWKIAGVVIFLVLVASFKKLFKLASVMFLILFIYVLYMIMVGADPQEIIEDMEESREVIFDEAKDISEEIKEKKEELNSIKKDITKPKKKSMMQKLKEKESSVMEKFKKEEENIMDKFKKEEAEYMDRFKELEG